MLPDGMETKIGTLVSIDVQTVLARHKWVKPFDKVMLDYTGKIGEIIKRNMSSSFLVWWPQLNIDTNWEPKDLTELKGTKP